MGRGEFSALERLDLRSSFLVRSEILYTVQCGTLRGFTVNS